MILYQYLHTRRAKITKSTAACKNNHKKKENSKFGKGSEN